MGLVSQIEKVFAAASHRKVWDHFTKAQRKNIDLWKKQSLELHVPQESLETHDIDEMEMSDDDDLGNLRYGKRSRNDMKDGESKKSDSTAYVTNPKFVDLCTNVKEQQLKVLNETIRNLQTQLLENKTKEKESLTRINELEDKLKQANVKELLLKTRIVDASKGSITSISEHTCDSNDSDKEVVCLDDRDQDALVNESHTLKEPLMAATSSELDKSESESGIDMNHHMIDAHEARLIGLISSFLVVHPFGASLDHILAYVQQVLAQLRAKDVQIILRRHKTIFTESNIQPNVAETSWIGDRKWKFCGFDQINDSTIVIHD